MAPAEPGDALLALANKVDRVDRRLDQIVERVTRLADTVAQVAQVAQRGRVAGGGDGEEQPPLPSWLLVDDESDAVEMLDELFGWVDAVYLRFEGAALPPCWQRHPDLVEELVALRGGWVEAYEGPKRSWKAVGDWLDRRPKVVQRLSELEICEVEQHQPGHERPTGREWDLPAPKAPLRSQIEPIAHAWALTKSQPSVTQEELDQAMRHAKEQASNTL